VRDSFRVQKTGRGRIVAQSFQPVGTAGILPSCPVCVCRCARKKSETFRVSGSRFRVSRSEPETSNLKPETVPTFCASICAGRREPTSVTRRTAGKMPAVPTGETHCATVAKRKPSFRRWKTVSSPHACAVQKVRSPVPRGHRTVPALRLEEPGPKQRAQRPDSGVDSQPPRSGARCLSCSQLQLILQSRQPSANASF